MFSSKRPVAFGTLLVLTACASGAPPLPPDTSAAGQSDRLTLDQFASADRALSCSQIESEEKRIDLSMRAANAKIEGNRTQNQVAGYLGAMLIVPLVATDNNNEEKEKIRALYTRRDVLITLAAVKKCGVKG